MNKNDNIKKATKDKDLSPLQFLERLQLEYICSELRKKIYFSVKDKAYYTKLMGFKKDSIENISKRNNLENMFTSEIEKEKMYNKVYPILGFPIFTYNSKEHKEQFEPQDLKNYYSIGSDVKVFIGENKENLLGKIKSVNFENKIVEIEEVNGKFGIFNLTQITRIL